MAEMNKIQSFKTFSQLKAEEKEIQLQEEAKGKREQLITKIGETLAEMDITSFDELSEEQKQALIAKLFNEEIKEVEAEESIEEGNAFIFAAAKAKQDGKSEFEFNGKTYKVTLKKDTGLKESYQLLITEATRWQFGIIDKAGNIESNYVHFDGYPSSVIPQIKGMDAKKVREILKNSEMGGMSSLTEPYNDSQESTINKGTVKNIKKYLKEVESGAGAEYVYLFDEKSGKWVGADTYVDKDLKPVDQIEESVVTEANYSLSKLEDMGFKAGEDYFEKVKALLKNGPDLKAYKNGFTQGFVDNAAAYGVKESVVTEGAKEDALYKKQQLARLKDAKKDSESTKRLLALQQKQTQARIKKANEEESVVTEGKKVKVTKKDIEDIEDSGNIDIAYRKAMAILTSLVESVVTEGKDDFMARYKDTNINLKKGYKHLNDEELNQLYLELGEFIADNKLKVKDATLVFESEVTEAEVKSDEDFKEYAETVLKKAFGEDYDEAKAGEVINGLTSKYSGDYGAMVGALQSSLD